MGEKEFDGVNERRLEITEGKRGRMGVSTNLGTNVNRRKMTNSMYVDVMVNVCAKRGNEGNRVSFKIGNTWEKAKEVPFYVLFLWNPILFSTVVDNSVLVWVTINSESTSRGVEEMREKVGYRLFT